MTKITYQITTIVLFLVYSCSTPIESKKSIETIKNLEMDEIDYYPEMVRAHINAKELMNEEFYYSPVDETAPFGSDDAADTYSSFAEWRQSNKKDNPIIFFKNHIAQWGYPLFDLKITNFEELKSYINESPMHLRYLSGIDQSILAIAYGQLYLEGTISNDIKELGKTALIRQLDSNLITMWPENYQEERRVKLLKMKDVLSKVSNNSQY